MLGLATSANAATATSNFTVSATVVATCTIGATNLGFGNYTGTQTDSSSTITVTCTNSTGYTVGLSSGSGTVAARKMTSGAASLNYSLTTDAARANNWTDIGGGNVATGTGAGSAQTLTVFGRIPGAQYPTPGAYTDTITATVSY